MTKSFCDTDSFLEAFKFGFLDLFLEEFHEEIMVTEVVSEELQRAPPKLRKEVSFVPKDFHQKFNQIEVVDARRLLHSKKKPGTTHFSGLSDGEHSCILYMLENKTPNTFISDDSDVLRYCSLAKKKHDFNFLPILIFIIDTERYEKFRDKLINMYQKFYVHNTKIPEETEIMITYYAEEYLGQSPLDVRD